MVLYASTKPWAHPVISNSDQTAIDNNYNPNIINHNSSTSTTTTPAAAAATTT
jgi:uncharacterized membrane protein